MTNIAQALGVPVLVLTLHLGRNRQGNLPPVSDDDFDRWLSDVVSPVLGGFNVAPTVGYWQGQREESARLEFWADMTQNTATERAKVHRLAADYVARFGQQAVGVTERWETVGFITRGEPIDVSR